MPAVPQEITARITFDTPTMSQLESNEQLQSANCQKLSDRNSRPPTPHSGRRVMLFMIVVSVAALACSAIGQTVFGQQGTILSPSADPYTNGSFAAGSYFRSIYSGVDRFDIAPFYLLIGVSPKLDVGFAFPALWGGRNSPIYSDDYAQLGVKYRLHGAPEELWRFAVGVFAQRGITSADSILSANRSSAGMELISSHNVWNGYQFHLYGGGVLTNSVGVETQGFGGLGVDRYIATNTQFVGDISAASERRKSAGTSVQAMIGIRYSLLPNLQTTFGGGIGLAEENLDWQYAIGLSFSSNSRTINLFEGGDEMIEPPPLAELPEIVSPPVVGVEQTSTPQAADKLWPGEVELTSRLFFDFAQFELGENEMYSFRELQDEISSLDSGVHLRLIGHADYVGQSRSNLAWGMARTLHVLSLTVNRTKILPDRFFLSSEGESSPSDKRITEAANQLNRRAVVRTWHQYEAAYQEADRLGLVWPLTDAAVEVSNQDDAVAPLLSLAERAAAMNAMKQIGAVDSNQVLLIESYWNPDTPPWPALRRAASMWLYLIVSTSIDPSQLLLHLHPSQQEAAHSISESEPLWTVEMLQRIDHESSIDVSLRIDNRVPNHVHEGFGITVADFPDYRITSYGDSIAVDQDPIFSRGTYYRFQKRVFREFQLAIRNSDPKAALLSLYMYDKNGQLLGRIPLYNSDFETSWYEKFRIALGANDTSVIGRNSIELRVLRVDSSQ
jgi:outer membrane protein OmpA-like peptidoglycan-associated protein